MKSLPLDLELVVYAGTTMHREFRWLPEGGTTPVDFTGWSGLMLIGPYGGEAVYELSPGQGMTLTADGRLIIELTPLETEDLYGRTDLAYQVDLTDSAGFVLRFLHGRVSVWRDVERMP